MRRWRGEGLRRPLARHKPVLSLPLVGDGKALRRGYERGKSHMPPVMVTAWAAQTRMALANTLAPGNNEAAGALQLIELLQLKGCVVTVDALHCHRGIAKAIVARGGDYVLAVKGNQPALLAEPKPRSPAAERKGKASGHDRRCRSRAQGSAHGHSLHRSRTSRRSTTSRASSPSPGSPASAAATKPSSATS